MPSDEIVILTDHSSAEGGRDTLATAVQQFTGRAPLLVDARRFMTGGSDVADIDAATVIVYEIPPHRRRDFEVCQQRLKALGVHSLGTDVEAWRVATEKNLTIERFLLTGIPHMATLTLSSPTTQQASDAIGLLGGDVWARPSIGTGGDEVFHITTVAHMAEAMAHYASSGSDWLVAADAQNFNQRGLRHQYRVVVLDDEVIRAVEHIQADPDAPCNECKGAVSTVMRVEDLPPGMADLALAATRAVGLPLAGVDLATENGGVVFEVNVHPVFGSDGGLEQMALPYVAAHLPHVLSAQPV
ncbi:ATP-grasp domain-containing protein [Lentzea sp. HUAS TT2]|uniref:ATP-grasp domain-containing protein n=1 Tax=Lentzea sp. HUAS TT2 TaxID=3447454 RepID=UPI003F70BD64